MRPSSPALAALGNRRVGETLDLLGPGGRAADLPHPNGTLSLIAQGLSLGPLLSILDRTPCAAQVVTLAPTAAQVYPRELLPRHVAYAPHVGHEEQPAFWRAVAEACAWGQRLYAAGTIPFYRSLREVLGATRLGHAGTAQVWLESEIVCGQGHCRGCVVETRRGWRRVCTDGPLFDLADLLLD
jgi:dihydroorotate dehydrogenase electron transfer subunit